MNKYGQSRCSSFRKSTASQQNFRVVMKKRSGYKETVDPREISKQSKFIINHNPQKQCIPATSPLKESRKMEQSHRDLTNLKKYVKNNIKTENSEKCLTMDVIPRSTMSKNTEIPDLNQRKDNTNQSRISIISSKSKKQELETIQKQLDTILRSKLQKLSVNKHLSPMKTKTLPDESEQELRTIIKHIKTMNDENQEDLDSQIEASDQKIRMFQKMIAEGATQSQMSKKYYLGQVSKAIHNNLSLSQSSNNFYNSEEIKRSCRPNDSQFSAKSISCESTSNHSYKKPEKQAYHIYKYKNTFFNADRHMQPLPRSSYNREYLLVGGGKQLPCKPNDSGVMKNSQHQKMSTSYRDSFYIKRSNLVNYKQLDCFKDKYRKLPISYNKNQHKEAFSADKARLLNLQSEKKRQTVTMEPYLKNHLQSQSRRQYLENKASFLKSNIKHSNLQKLKYLFKKTIKA